MWPTFDIRVAGSPPVVYQAPNRGQAMHQAWQDFRTYDDQCSFRKFESMASVEPRKRPVTPDGYDYIRSAYGVDVRIGKRVTLQNEGPLSGKQGVVLYPNKPSAAHVRVLLDGASSAALVHPMSVVLGSHPVEPEPEATSPAP